MTTEEVVQMSIPDFSALWAVSAPSSESTADVLQQAVMQLLAMVAVCMHVDTSLAQLAPLQAGLAVVQIIKARTLLSAKLQVEQLT